MPSGQPCLGMELAPCYCRSVVSGDSNLWLHHAGALLCSHVFNKKVTSCIAKLMLLKYLPAPEKFSIHKKKIHKQIVTLKNEDEYYFHFVSKDDQVYFYKHNSLKPWQLLHTCISLETCQKNTTKFRCQNYAVKFWEWAWKAVKFGFLKRKNSRQHLEYVTVGQIGQLHHIHFRWVAKTSIQLYMYSQSKVVWRSPLRRISAPAQTLSLLWSKRRFCWLPLGHRGSCLFPGVQTTVPPWGVQCPVSQTALAVIWKKEEIVTQ